MSVKPEKHVPFLFCKGEESYKYVDLDINDDGLYSNGISDRINIQKTDAIDLLTKKIDFNEIDFCANFNFYYCDEPFTVKLDNFSGYVVKDICQKRYHFLIVQSDVMRNMFNKIFHVINNRVNRNAEKCNWLCSSGLIRIKAGRIPTYKITYVKGVKVLFDGVREVNCNGFKKYYIDVQVCEGKMLLPENYCPF